MLCQWRKWSNTENVYLNWGWQRRTDGFCCFYFPRYMRTRSHPHTHVWGVRKVIANILCLAQCSPIQQRPNVKAYSYSYSYIWLAHKHRTFHSILYFALIFLASILTAAFSSLCAHNNGKLKLVQFSRRFCTTIEIRNMLIHSILSHSQWIELLIWQQFHTL